MFGFQREPQIKLGGHLPINAQVRNMRAKALSLIAGVLLSAAAVPAATARVARPVIKGEEAGYFGSATLAHRIDVFVYSNVAPRAGAEVVVCVGGKCKRAVGHSRPAPWYSASFSTHGMPMGAPVHFSVRVSDAAGQAAVSVTRPLLCMHNNGSTPQH